MGEFGIGQPVPREEDPYLLRGVSITEPNRVWASDITYIPMAQGFLYLVAIIDWATRAVLAWRLSNTMDTGFCIAALDEEFAKAEAEEFATSLIANWELRRSEHLVKLKFAVAAKKFFTDGADLSDREVLVRAAGDVGLDAEKTREMLASDADVQRVEEAANAAKEAGIDGVILAGTELPLILCDPEYNGIPFLNTTKIHCEAAVAEMLS